MTIQLCSLHSYYQNYCADEIQEEHWPVSFQPSERLNAGKNPSHPGILFSPLHGIMEVWRPSKKRAVVDRFCDRLKKSQCTGAQLAIDYLHEKYSQNLAAATIASAGGTILSFLSFLAESEVDISQVSKQIIGRYIERDQDNGLKTGAIRTKLRVLYTFIGFLVDRKILPYEILHKKIRIKPEDLLPKAIPAQDIKSILGVIETTRDKALILLLLRTGMRIGELLNVVVSDIQLPERKILLYLGEKNYQGRVVYYSEDAEKALKDWIDIRDKNRQYLFYSRTRQNISYVTAWNMFKEAIEAAGLSGKGYSLHSLCE